MDKITLKAKLREITGKKVASLREEGLIPAVLYGHKVENKNLVIDTNEFIKIFKVAGTSTIIDLEIEGGENVKVIVSAIQRDPVKHIFIHVDLQQINMKEEITADVALKFIGESPAVKTLGGVLLTSLEHIRVKCLPADLPHDISVDLSKLEAIDSHILVKDLEASKEVTILNDADDVIAVIKAIREEKEEVTREVDGEKKKEGEEAKKENNQENKEEKK